MATVLEPKPIGPSKVEIRVESELRRAAAGIRTTDVLTGVAVLLAVGLGYAVAVMLIDRAVTLPEWGRQLGLVGFLAVAGFVTFRMIVRPLRGVVNPRFAARRVERTVDGPTNAVINWVDLRDRDLPTGVRSAIGSEAAEELADADLKRAADTRPLIWAGGAAALLLAALAVTFVVCKPPQFFSLLGRTFNPFTPTAIANQTQITLVSPDAGDVTITTGDALTVAVEIGGRVPDADAPDRVRLQYRHNPAAAFEEFPLAEAATHREWAGRVPDYVVQNGFTYRIAAGDAVTPEYRVTVRTRPQLVAYEVKYEYPAYLRMAPDVGREPRIEAYRGTNVTLTATANRPLKAGQLHLADQKSGVRGEVVGQAKDALRFTFTLDDSTTYRLTFDPAGNEPGGTSPVFPVKVLTDFPPKVVIDLPVEDEITLPTDGRLAVDAVVGDDFGIDTVSLRLRVVGDTPLTLKPVPYPNGESPSFRREADGSFPTSLPVKLSTALAGLTDETGRPVELKPQTVLEYWLEATDNCTEPAANVGSSVVKRVVLVAPPPEPEKQAANDQANARRAGEEQRHRRQQQDRLNTEKRPPPPPLHQDQPPPQPGDEPQDAAPEPGQQPEDGQEPPSGDPGQASPDGTPQDGGQSDPMNPKPDDPGQQNPDLNQPPEGQPGEPGSDGGNSKSEPGSTAPDAAADRDLQAKAEAVEQAIRDSERKPGDARSGGDAVEPKASAPPAEPKDGTPSEPMDKAESKDGQSKAEPGQPSDGAAQPKDAGTAEPPASPAESKAPPESPSDAGSTSQAGQPMGDTPKPEPKDGPPGQEKSPDPTGPSDPATTPKESQPGSARGTESKPDAGQPDPAAAKPNDAPEPGREKGSPPADAKAGSPDGGDPGRAKADQPSDPAAAKPSPDQTAGTPPDQSEPKGNPNPNDDTASAAGKPTDSGSPPPGQQKPPPPEKGELDREAGGKNDGTPTAGPEDVERLTRDAEKLGSDDPNERRQAEEQFDDLLGKKDRERLQDGVQKSKSGDASQREQAKDDVDELAKKAAQNETSPEPTPGEMNDMKNKAGDLASDDPAKRDAAEKEFDKHLGEQGRKELQKTMQQAKSGGDPADQGAARQKADDLAQHAAANKKAGEPSPEQIEAMKQKAADLASDDPAKRAAAEKEFDKHLGEAGRKELQKNMEQAKTGTPAERQDAKENADDLARDAAANKKKTEPTPDQIAQAKKAAEDLASDDPNKRAAAEKEFDKQLGEAGRKDLQKTMEQAKNGTPTERQEAKEKADELARDAAANKKAGTPTPEQVEEFKQKANDLASDDSAKRKAAEDEFDKRLGEQGRKDLQEQVNKQTNGDPSEQKAAADKADDLARQAAADKKADEQAREDAEQLARQAADLASDDSNKRKAAEDAIDRQIGEEKRQDLQQAMNDLKSGDPAKQQAALDKLKEMAQDAQDQAQNTPDGPPGTSDARGNEFRPNGAGGRGMDEKLHDDDPKYRLKTAALQLESLEKNRYNEELQKKLGYTQEEFDRFIESYRDMTDRLRDRVATTTEEPPSTPTGPPSLTVGGGERVEASGTPAAGAIGSVGPSAAPPGFADATRKFGEEAARLRRGATSPGN